MEKQLEPALQQTLEDTEVLQFLAKLSLSVPPEDDSDSYSSSSDFEDEFIDEDEYQSILDKAGCTTQLSNLELTPEGTVPVELVAECLQCLFLEKLWAGLIICKAIYDLHPSSLVAWLCGYALSERLQQLQEKEIESSGANQIGSDSEIGSVDSSDSDSDRESSDESQDDVKEEDKQCPICTD